MSDEFSELIQSEHAKRERNWDPAERWQVIQNTLTWGEQQKTVLRNTPAACLANQNRLLASFNPEPEATATPQTPAPPAAG